MPRKAKNIGELSAPYCAEDITECGVPDRPGYRFLSENLKSGKRRLASSSMHGV